MGMDNAGCSTRKSLSKYRCVLAWLATAGETVPLRHRNATAKFCKQHQTVLQPLLQTADALQWRWEPSNSGAVDDLGWACDGTTVLMVYLRTSRQVIPNTTSKKKSDNPLAKLVVWFCVTAVLEVAVAAFHQWVETGATLCHAQPGDVVVAFTAHGTYVDLALVIHECWCRVSKHRPRHCMIFVGASWAWRSYCPMAASPQSCPRDFLGEISWNRGWKGSRADTVNQTLEINIHLYYVTESGKSFSKQSSGQTALPFWANDTPTRLSFKRYSKQRGELSWTLFDCDLMGMDVWVLWLNKKFKPNYPSAELFTWLATAGLFPQRPLDIQQSS